MNTFRNHRVVTGGFFLAFIALLLAAYIPQSYAVEAAGDTCTAIYATTLYESGQTPLTCLPNPANKTQLLWQNDLNPDHSQYISLLGTMSLAFGRECKAEDLGFTRTDMYDRPFTCQLVSGRATQIWFDQNYVDQIKASFPAPAQPSSAPSPTLQQSQAPSPSVTALAPTVSESPTPSDVATPDPSTTPQAVRTIEGKVAKKIYETLLPIAITVGFVSAAASVTNLASTQTPTAPPQPNRSEGAPISDLSGIRTRDEFESLNKGKKGRGDFLRIWAIGFIRLDKVFTFFLPRVALATGKFSQAAANVLTDANYLRAISGSLSLAIYPIAAVIGYVSYEILPHQTPSKVISLLAVIIFIGALDSFAGVFFSLVFLSRHLLHGNLSDLHNLQLALWICFLSITPTFIARSIRPLSRVSAKQGAISFERIIDLALGAVATAWIFIKMLTALSDLKASDIAAISLVGDRNRLLYLIIAIIVIRYLLQSLALNQFPTRFQSMQILLTQSTIARLRSSILLALFFTFLSTPLFPDSAIGVGIALSVAFVLPAALFLLPIAPLRRMRAMNISGSARMVIVLLIGTYIAGRAGSIAKLTLTDHILGIAALMLPLFIFPLFDFLFRENVSAPHNDQNLPSANVIHIGSELIFITIIVFSAIGSGRFTDLIEKIAVGR